MTYNVHGCVGGDGKLDEKRIADVIASLEPDVVALQELDVARQRSRGIDQAAHIAEFLSMHFHFHPAMHMEEEKYGDAILSRLPLHLVQTGILPTSTSRLAFEPRGALLVRADVGTESVYVLNTHLGLSSSERIAQMEALLSPEWMAPSLGPGRFILCGDFNAPPFSKVYRMASRRLRDVQRHWGWHRVRNTYPSTFPLLRLDHIFVTPDFGIEQVIVPRSAATKIASDHLPMIADLRLD